MNKCTPADLHSVWIICMVQLGPKGNRQGAHMTVPKETGMQQISWGHQYFIKTTLKIIIIISIILRANTY